MSEAVIVIGECPLWKLEARVYVHRYHHPETVFWPRSRIIISVQVGPQPNEVIQKRTLLGQEGWSPRVRLMKGFKPCTHHVRATAILPDGIWAADSQAVVLREGETQLVDLELTPRNGDSQPAPERSADPIEPGAIAGDENWRGRQYWFNYFWNEAIGTAENRSDLGRLFTKMFSNRTKPLALRPEVSRWTDAEWLQVMTDLFERGFEKYPKAPQYHPYVTKAGMVRTARKRGDASPRLYAPASQAKAGDKRVLPDTITLPGGRIRYLAYRSDSRPHGEVTAVGGFNRQTEGNWANVIHASAAWNPLKAVGDFMYRRTTTVDSCLYTVVSFGPLLPPTVEFPKLTDGANYNQGWTPGPADRQWTDAQKSAAARDATKTASMPVTFEDVARKEQGAARIVTMPITRTSAYLIGLEADDEVVDTEGWQEDRRGEGRGFPERGIRKIPSSRLLAMMSFRRIHHDLTGVQSLTYLLEHIEPMGNDFQPQPATSAGSAGAAAAAAAASKGAFETFHRRLRAPAVIELDGWTPGVAKNYWLYTLGPIGRVYQSTTAANSRPCRFRLRVRLKPLAKTWLQGWLAAGLAVVGELVDAGKPSHAFSVERVEGDDAVVLTDLAFDAEPGAADRTAAFFLKRPDRLVMTRPAE